jgi:hypothetical protein
MPATQILGPPYTGVLPVLKPYAPRNDDMPVKLRSLSVSDLPKKIVSPERALVLPPVFDSDEYEVLSIQLETVHYN